MPDVNLRSVKFHNFKALANFSLHIQHTNILVGPNNCGKSTVLSAFRVLAAGLRRASAKPSEIIRGPGNREVRGYNLSPETLPLSLENVHTGYDETDTSIEFHLSNGNRLILYFPKDGGCSLIPHGDKAIMSPASFRAAFPIQITAVPILGPIEHEEKMFQKDTVGRNLLSHRASGNFRNFWYYYPDQFPQFAALVKETWPGMEIELPTLDPSDLKLTMFCREQRITRELFWAGYGFQVWCQLLTHIVHATDHALLVVDEADIYLHPDIQRQLVAIVRQLGPDIILATHSTEMMAEADPSELVVVDKNAKSGVRVKDAQGVQQALDLMGSIHNVTLSELARSRKILFVESTDDLKIIRGFASKGGYSDIAACRGVSPLESDGFSSWKRIRDFSWGLRKATASPPKIAAIFDRDYHSKEEVALVEKELKRAVEMVRIHGRKEIENYLLDPAVIDRAIAALVADKVRRHGTIKTGVISSARDLLLELSEDMKAETQAQIGAKRWEFLRSTGKDQATILAAVNARFDKHWRKLKFRLDLVSGKELLKRLNENLNKELGVTLTPAKLLLQLKKSEIPAEMSELLSQLDTFLKR